MRTQGDTVGKDWHATEMFMTRKLPFLVIVANFTGACVVSSYFIYFDQIQPLSQTGIMMWVIVSMLIALLVLGFTLTHRWEKSLLKFVHLKQHNSEVEPALTKSAQRKILDLPFVSALTSLFCWFWATVIMSIYRIVDPLDAVVFPASLVDAYRVAIGVIIAGIITCAIIFLASEIMCRRIWPSFFPEGGLTQTAVTFRLKLRARTFIIFTLASILPIVLMAVLSYNHAKLMLEAPQGEVIQSLLAMTAFLLIVTLAIAIVLSRLFATGIITPVSRMEAAMASVSAGNFSTTVKVNSNDELGVLADHFNQMTKGLEERYRMQQSLDLAKEVQQNLLPKQDPVVRGLDIAGRSIYCDETGGDYFDYLEYSETGRERFGIVVGDVSGHGIPSALLMATARAFIRQRAALAGSIAEVVSDINKQLSRDVEDTGGFMTLFYLLIDISNRRLHWVRAGHDPAVLYDPAQDRFEDLHGQGIALGIDESWRYSEYEHVNLKNGQVILLSTDGIWEAQNPQSKMFGKTAMYDIIRENAGASARDILNAVISGLNHFKQGTQAQDDETLVVIKTIDIEKGEQ